MPTTSKEPEFLTTREAAALLGVGFRTVGRWCALGLIPHLKIAGTVRFRRAALLAWIEERERETMAAKRGGGEGMHQ